FFFLRADDGIRGFHVTGVQTCALPISDRAGCRTVRVCDLPAGAGRGCATEGHGTGGWHGDHDRLAVAVDPCADARPERVRPKEKDRKSVVEGKSVIERGAILTIK